MKRTKGTFMARGGDRGVLPTSGKGNRHRLRQKITLEDQSFEGVGPGPGKEWTVVPDVPKGKAKHSPDPRSLKGWARLLNGMEKMNQLIIRGCLLAEMRILERRHEPA